MDETVGMELFFFNSDVPKTSFDIDVNQYTDSLLSYCSGNDPYDLCDEFEFPLTADGAKAAFTYYLRQFRIGVNEIDVNASLLIMIAVDNFAYEKFVYFSPSPVMFTNVSINTNLEYFFGPRLEIDYNKGRITMNTNLFDGSIAQITDYDDIDENHSITDSSFMIPNIMSCQPLLFVDHRLFTNIYDS